jgi:hypothetical protein
MALGPFNLILGVWESMEQRKSKDALFWRDKTFPYYDDLFILYDGEFLSI